MQDGKALHGLSASGGAPAATWSRDYFLRKEIRHRRAAAPMRGWDSVTVPGAVLPAWAALSERFGPPPLLRPDAATRSASPSAATSRPS
ncbi:hypothetical protein ACU4GA_17740 [Methylobacterium oryzae CBMB20]